MAAKKTKPKGAPESAAALAAATATVAEVLNGGKPDELPGMVGEGVEKPYFPDVVAAAELFDDFKQRISDLKQGRDEAQEKLIAAMASHGDLTFYEYTTKKGVDKIATAKHGKVKVAVKTLGVKEHE